MFVRLLLGIYSLGYIACFMHTIVELYYLYRSSDTTLERFVIATWSSALVMILSFAWPILWLIDHSNNHSWIRCQVRS